MVDVVGGAVVGSITGKATETAVDKANPEKKRTEIDVLEDILKKLSGPVVAGYKIINLSTPTTGKTSVLADNRYRDLRLIHSQGPASSDEFAYKIGSTILFTFFNPTGTTMFDIPVPINDGMDISIVDITTPAAVNWRAYLFAKSIEEL